MKNSEMDKLIAHCSHYFKQGEPRVIHNPTLTDPHIDVLLYEPSDAYPFWKMVTMGASDFKMPDAPKLLGNRNEYMIVKSVRSLKQQHTAFQFYKQTNSNLHNSVGISLLKK